MVDTSATRFAHNLAFGFLYLILGVACLLGYAVFRVMAGLIIAIPALLAGLFFLIFGARSIVRAFRLVSAEQTAISIQEAVRRGSLRARFGLYLRPFALDYSVHAANSPSIALDEIMRRRTRGKTPPDFETVLTAGVNHLLGEEFDWICLGRPGEFEGAGRIATTDEEWRRDIERLAESATLIVLVISGRAGTQWELGKTIERGWINKTIFVVPSNQESFSLPGGYVSELDYDQGVAQLVDAGFAAPPFSRAGALFCYPNGQKTPEVMILDDALASDAGTRGLREHARALAKAAPGRRVSRKRLRGVVTTILAWFALVFWLLVTIVIGVALFNGGLPLVRGALAFVAGALGFLGAVFVFSRPAWSLALLAAGMVATAASLITTPIVADEQLTNIAIALAPSAISSLLAVWAVLKR